MKSASISLIPGLLVAWLASFGGIAAAQSTWNLGGSSCNPGTACTISGTTATMSAIGNTGTGQTFVTGTLSAYDPSGFGATTGSNENGNNGQHAFDNLTTGCVQNDPTSTVGCGGSVEALVIGFGTAKVNLTSLAIGWYSGDSDVSVLRWDGVGDPTASFGSLTAAQLQSGSAGWKLISSKDVDYTGIPIDNVNTSPATAPNDGAYQFNVKDGVGYDAANNNKVSSWWMISTYFGANNSAGYLEAGDDRFKLLNFAVNVCTGTVTGGSSSGNGGTCSTTIKVSEPGSLALVAISLMGFFYSRRKVVGLGSSAGQPRAAGAC